MKLEICIDTLAEATAAKIAQVDRVEVCSALDVGGLTPSAAMIKSCVALQGAAVHVMTRPRSGNFNYSALELKLMSDEIKIAADYGAVGVVFGALSDKMELDLAANGDLLAMSKLNGLEATFHRAFDFTSDPIAALDQLIALGFDRLLTSGQQASAELGSTLIAQLVQQSSGRIEIMAGAGISPDNSQKLIDAGVDALHFSARKTISSSNLAMGTSYEPDVQKIETIKRIAGHAH